MERYISGQSVRSIARAENRDRGTIAEILRGPEIREIIAEQRRRVFALLPLAVRALEINLKLGEDGGLARNILLDTGVLPRPRELETLISAAPDLQSRTLELLEKLGVATAPQLAENGEAAKNSTPAMGENDERERKPAADKEKDGGARGPELPR